MKEILILLAISFLVLGITMYFYMNSKDQFIDLGGSCNPGIENTCGKDAICQPNETGKKGVCFPKPDEEKEKTE
jgi:hypothetical protein